MGDVLEHGRERHPTPRWVGPAALTIALIVGGYALTHQDPLPAAADQPRQPTDRGTPRADGSPAPAVAGQDPWPVAEGACGQAVRLPLLSVEPLTERTGLQVLVAGDGLRVVDVDTGRVRRLPGAEPSATQQVTSLAASSDGVTALRQFCDSDTVPTGVALRVDLGSDVRLADVEPVDALLTAPDRSWGFGFSYDPREPVVLRPVDGSALVPLPTGFSPAAATTRLFVGHLDMTDADSFQQPSPLATVSRSTGTVRRLGRGSFLGASNSFVLTRSTCDSTTWCTVTRTMADGSTRGFPLPRGRAPASLAVISDDARRAAFLLSRPQPDARYYLGHPAAPSDVAVLDLVTGRLRIVPGVELAPRSTAGLAFSADGSWLAIALNEGTRARLLVWRSGLDRPQESPARLPGPVRHDVPVLDVTGSG